MPRINADIEAFVQMWDNHPIRSARNKTPNQLWILGKLHYNPNQDNSQIDNYYGIDHEGPSTTAYSDTETSVQDIFGPLTFLEMASLRQNFDFLSDSDSFGIDIYMNVLNAANEIVGTREM